MSSDELDLDATIVDLGETRVSVPRLYENFQSPRLFPFVPEISTFHGIPCGNRARNISNGEGSTAMAVPAINASQPAISRLHTTIAAARRHNPTRMPTRSTNILSRVPIGSGPGGPAVTTFHRCGDAIQRLAQAAEKLGLLLDLGYN